MSGRRTAVFSLGAMLSAAVLAEWARPTIKESDRHPGFILGDLIPVRFGDWRVDSSVPVILPSPDQLEVLNKIYNQTLARTYVDREGRRIMLSLAYGGDQSDGLTVHLPEVCYLAQGFRLAWTRDASLSTHGVTIPVRQVLTTMNGRIEPITYWVMMGDRATISVTQRRIVSLRYGLRRRIPEGLLVRISSIDAEVERALQLQATFIREMLGYIPPQQRQRLIGQAPGAFLGPS